jgi:lysophospholipase L1-like esterase
MTSIGHIGDSLTYANGTGDYAQESDYQSLGFADYTVDGLIGRFVWNSSPSPSTQTVLDSWLAEGFDPDHLVIALGTNDCINSKSAYWFSAVNSLLSYLSRFHTKHLWWVNLAGDNVAGADGTVGSKGNTVASYNAFLGNMLASSGFNIIDWNAYVKYTGSPPSWWSDPTNHVHMTPTGYAARQAFITSKIRSAP